MLQLEAVSASGQIKPVELDKAPRRVLPSETCRGFIIFPVTIQGTTLKLLFDTGSSWTFLDPEALNRVLGREVRAGSVNFPSAMVGDHDLGRLKVRIYPMKSLGRAVGYPIDGILGFPAFKDVLLTLDYPASEVRVESGGLPRPDGREIFRDTGWKRPFLELDLGTRKVEVLLDSGAVPGFVKLKPRDSVDWLVTPRPAQAAAHFTGIALRPGGRLSGTLALGPVRIENPVAFLDEAERLVGWQIMRHLELTFDQKKKRIRIITETAAAITTPPYIDKGIATRPRLEGLEVIKVFEETEAAAAGLRAGDLIVAIDGIPVYERPCNRLEGDTEGREARISYLRDGVAAEVKVRAVALIP